MKTPAFRLLALMALVAGLGPSAPAAAHHSFAMYDPAKLVTLTGTVQDFEWTNPHSIVLLVVDGAVSAGDGLWSLELPTSPGNLTRMNWTKRSLKPGDRVSIDINPLRDGRHGGSLKKVTLLATGQVLTVGQTGPVVAGGK
jgi:hypothetical protein